MEHIKEIIGAVDDKEPQLFCTWMGEGDEWNWEELCNDLTELLTQMKNGDSRWKARVENFGWRNLKGEKSFTAESGEELLKEILPDTDCRFRVYLDADSDVISIQNFHHDSPTGNEWYYIEREACDE